MESEESYHPKLMTPQEAVAEASRCLGCDEAPCRKGCPAQNDIVRFIRQVAQQNFRGAIKTVREANVLAGTCALICPVGELCESRCGSKLERPIAIGALQRFVAEYERARGMSLLAALPPNGHKIGVTGSGPAGLSAAFELARLGYSVEIHEAEDLPGGILTYGIPSYRLNPQIVQDEIDYVKAAGVKIISRSRIHDLASFSQSYDAVFIGVGAYCPLRLGVEGQDLEEVYQAVDYLRDRKISRFSGRRPMIHLGKNVIVIGGGNTAMDAALSARFSRSGVTIMYRRGENDLPAFRREIARAKEHGVTFEFNLWPVRFRLVDGRLEATFCRTRPGPIDETGRPLPIPVEGSSEAFLVDSILIAVGQGPTFRENQFIKTNKHGLIVVDETTGATSMKGVFAGGDAVNGGTTAVQAVAEGKRAARGIDRYITSSTQGDAL